MSAQIRAQEDRPFRLVQHLADELRLAAEEVGAQGVEGDSQRRRTAAISLPSLALVSGSGRRILQTPLSWGAAAL